MRVQLQIRQWFAATILFTAPLLAVAQEGLFLSADTRVDTYQLIQERFGTNSTEVPDCGHSEFGPHITQQPNAELGEDVFAFHLHVDYDNDRCRIYDRQRTELTTYQSKAYRGDTKVFEWRFRLDEDYTPSTFWNHFFQIRPIDSVPGGNPVFTFSMLSGDTEELLFYNDAGNGMNVLHRTPLAPFKGQWIKARVRAEFSLSGFVEVQLSRVEDGKELLDWRKDGVNLWLSTDTHYTLPKWGNYRSLEGEGPLDDETILYNDFCVVDDGESCDSLRRAYEIKNGFARTSDGSDRSGGIEVTTGPIDPFPTDHPLGDANLLRLLSAAAQASGNAVQGDDQPGSTAPILRENSNTKRNEKDGFVELLRQFFLRLMLRAEADEKLPGTRDATTCGADGGPTPCQPPVSFR